MDSAYIYLLVPEITLHAVSETVRNMERIIAAFVGILLEVKL